MQLADLTNAQRILYKLNGISLQITQANWLVKRWHVMVDIPFWKRKEKEKLINIYFVRQ